MTRLCVACLALLFLAAVNLLAIALHNDVAGLCASAFTDHPSVGGPSLLQQQQQEKELMKISVREGSCAFTENPSIAGSALLQQQLEKARIKISVREGTPHEDADEELVKAFVNAYGLQKHLDAEKAARKTSENEVDELGSGLCASAFAENQSVAASALLQQQQATNRIKISLREGAAHGLHAPADLPHNHTAAGEDVAASAASDSSTAFHSNWFRVCREKTAGFRVWLFGTSEKAGWAVYCCPGNNLAKCDRDCKRRQGHLDNVIVVTVLVTFVALNMFGSSGSKEYDKTVAAAETAAEMSAKT